MTATMPDVHEDPSATMEPDLIGAAALLQGPGRPGDGEAGTLLEAFARRRRSEGWSVSGLIQTRDPDTGLRHLVDLDSGHPYPITQELGTGSESCVVDPHGVAEASGVLRRVLDRRDAAPGIMIINKFGRLESEGEGLVDETLEAMAEGYVVLTSVHDSYRAAFEDRTGGLAKVLACTEEALEDWWRDLSAQLPDPSEG